MSEAEVQKGEQSFAANFALYSGIEMLFLTLVNESEGEGAQSLYVYLYGRKRKCYQHVQE